MRPLDRRTLLLGASALALAACSSSGRSPQLSIIYSPSAKFHGPDRNPIIVIPGLLGSRLRDPGSGKLIWGAFDSEGVDPSTDEGFRLISLSPDPPRSIGEAQDGIKTDGVLDHINLSIAGIAFVLQAYAEILATLGVGGYRDEALGLGGEIDYGREHFTCFQFAYDWRLDNVANARRLRDFIREKRIYVQGEYKKHFNIANADVKFDIVAHSMGGLVARYFAMFGGDDLPADGSTPKPTWEGAKYVDRTIMVGTPNGGSLDALRALVEGRDFGAPIIPSYRSSLLGSFPSIYQLLPRARFNSVVSSDTSKPIDIMDPETWHRLGWGLAAPKVESDLALLMPKIADPAERRRIALDFQSRALARAKQFMAALDQPATPPPNAEFMVVAGDAIQTEARMTVDPKSGALSVADTAPGDGLVLRSSAVLDERFGQTWQPNVRSPLKLTRALFLPDEHLALTRSPIFRDNVLYWLLEEPRPGRISAAS